MLSLIPYFTVKPKISIANCHFTYQNVGFTKNISSIYSKYCYYLNKMYFILK